LLFQLNDESLPGYISNDVPAGISNYRPASASIEAALLLNKRFKHSKRALSRYALYSLFLTGSSGTIAHSRDSDFDIWICHRPQLDAEAVGLLEAKAAAISKWCASLNLEVHFFIMDEMRFRQDNRISLNKENCGSALDLLLLEEFYRTSVLIARTPGALVFCAPGTGKRLCGMCR